MLFKVTIWCWYVFGFITPFGIKAYARELVKEALIETWNPEESFVSLSRYMIDNGMNIKPLPKIKVIKDDEENASLLLGKTAYYAKQSQQQADAVDNSFMKQSDPRMPLFAESKATTSFGKGK